MDQTEALSYIEEITSKCDEVQQRVLVEILTQNAETEYLKRHGILDGCVDRETFKSKVPVVTYEDILPDIQRIVNEGNSSPILCAHPISEFLASSGTSGGARKLTPLVPEYMNRKVMFHSLARHVIKQHIPELHEGTKALNFTFTYEGTTTPSGLIAYSVITSFLRNTHLKSRPSNLTSPYEAIFCTDPYQSMYAQVLCGLYQRDEVVIVGSSFASSLIRAIGFLQRHCDELCHDISSGTLSSKVTEPALRECLIGTFMHKPHPELAQFVNLACKEDNNLKGIIKKIWPNTKYLQVIVTGAMAQYIPALDHYSDGLPKVSAVYCGSECDYGINLNPLCNPYEISYTIIPTMAYFEFLPLDTPGLIDSSASPALPQLVDLADVTIGKEYEIVITNYAGLYRFRVGDVLRVTSFHNSTPQFKYVRRKNVLLSIHSDKTDESDLQKAIDDMSNSILQPVDVSVVDYTSYADTNTYPGHYVIYLELMMKDPTKKLGKEVLEKCCFAIEETLDSWYRYYRVKEESLGPLEIRVLKNGTFEMLMDNAISRGVTINQFKVPRCINSTAMMELLNSQLVSTHFSPCLPHFTTL